MRSLLGRFHRPFARGVDEQLLLLNNLGDGSTLSLDFTTGVLDPRLTFTRSTNATFINSQGYVQFANANLMTYSNPRQTGTAWAVTGSVTWGSSTISDPNGGSNAQSITFGTTGSAIFNTTGTTVVSGITHTFSVWMRSATGTTTVRIGDANVAPVATVTLTTTWQRFSCQYTTSGTNDGGAIYSQTGTPSAEFYVWGAQVQPGSIVGELIQTSGTINTNTPRFDYDPSTRQPRGLLIEGTSNNLARYSETLEATGGFWGYNEATRTVESSDVNPTGGTGSISFAPASNGGSRYAGIFLTGQTTASTYTYSVWLKGKGTTACVISIQSSAGGQNATMTILSQPAGANASIAGDGTGFPRISNLSTTGWTKVQVVLSANLGGTGTLRVFMYPNDTSAQTTADSIFAWGAQLEAGSGASSYIPTGASTGSRAADSCYLTDFAGWSAGGNFSTTEGTLFVDQAVTFVGTANYPIGGFSTSNTSGSRFGWQYRQGDSPRQYRGLVNAGYIYELPASVGWSIPDGTTRFRHAMSCGGGTSAFLRQSLKSSASSGAPTQNNYSDTSTLNISGAAAFTLTHSVFTASVRIARVKYWPRAFTLAELDALTN